MKQRMIFHIIMIYSHAYFSYMLIYKEDLLYRAKLLIDHLMFYVIQMRKVHKKNTKCTRKTMTIVIDLS